MIIPRYILAQFFRTFTPTFVVMVFFLLMQFLWKYVDDLVGKGVEWYYIVELLLLTIPSTLPLAMPLSVLLASLMTYGSMGEYNELAALKSSGVSLLRSMRVLMGMVIFLAATEVVLANYLTPVANLKGQSMLENITRKKPALNIREGVFYGGIAGYSIKVGKKSGPDQTRLHDVIIYDQTKKQGNSKMILAQSGKMEVTPDQMFLVIELYDGHSYEDLYPERRADRLRHPFTRTDFKKSVIRFSLSDFHSTNLREESRRGFSMLNISQLQQGHDSLDVYMKDRVDEMQTALVAKYRMYPDSVPLPAVEAPTQDPLLAGLSKPMKLRAIENGLRLARANRSFLEQFKAQYDWNLEISARYIIEQHKKFSMAFACIVFFFIGAPLGAIIRKGGIGLPVVISVFIFIVFWVMTVTLDKMGRELIIDPISAAWLSNLVLLPFGIFLTIKSNSDSSLFNLELYKKPLFWLQRKLGKKQ